MHIKRQANSSNWCKVGPRWDAQDIMKEWKWCMQSAGGGGGQNRYRREDKPVYSI